jgi:hypothetical protein
VSETTYDFSSLRALVFNGTLAKSPGESHAERAVDRY